MATEIDSLDIKINANAKKATDSIDTLVKKLDVLSTSLSKVNGSSLSGLASGVQRLGNATKALQSVKASDYTRIAKGFKSFAEVDGSKLSQTAGGLNTLAGSLMLLSNVKGTENVASTINAIKNLAKVDMSGFDTTKMNTIASTVSNFASQLSGVSSIESSVVRLVSAMARLAGTGASIVSVEANFESLGNKVVSFASSMSSVGSIDTNLARLIDGIARLASAGAKIPTTVANLTALGDGVKKLLTTLSSAPAVNTNLANMVQGLGNIASSGRRAGTVTNNLSSSMSRTSSGAGKATGAFKKLLSMFKRTKKSSNGLASSIGKFYAKCFLVIRGVKKLGEAIGSAQDYIEEFNYFSVAMDKIGKDSAGQYKKAGYESAETYADSFRTRFAKLQKQMTGYDVDYDTGEATSEITHNLGLNLTEVMNYNAAISQITNSAGMLGETSVATSKALTMLSADWHSLSNQDLSTVMDNFQSGLIGQSRALYKYGIDITSVGLAQTALNHGIKTSVKNMSQQSKMQLRVLTMLEQSKVAYGDLAKTINQPANQLRMLQNGFKNLAVSIGNVFLPIVEKVYPYLNAIVMVLQEFVQWIGKLTGAKAKDSDTSFSTPDYDSTLDGADELAEKTKETEKSSKKISDNIQGFDKLNKLDKKNSDDDDDKKNADIDLSSDIASALGKYEKIWDKMFKSSENKAVQLAKRIKKALLGGWETGDFSKLGKAFASWVNKGLKNIPWNKIQKTTKKMAKSIATFLNGAISDLDWSLIGKTLSESLNTATVALYTFVEEFDWLTLGESIANGINSAIKNYDWLVLGKTLGSSLRGVIQTAFGLVEEFDFSTAGKKIGDSINGFFEDMGEIRDNTGLTGWQELGKAVSDGIKGVLDTINTAFSSVEWSEVGSAIGQFLGEIDWFGILAGVGKVIVNAIWSAIKVAFSAFKESPEGIIAPLVTILGGSLVFKNLSGLVSILGKGLSQVFSAAAGTINIAGILMAVIGAETVALIELLNAGIENYYGVDNKTYETDLTKKQVKEIENSFSKIEEAAKDTKTAIKGTKAALKEVGEIDGKSIDDMADSYFKLSQKANPTKNEIAAMKKYSEELSEVIPGLSDNIDKQTGAFKGSSASLKDLIRNYERTKKAQVAYEKSIELYEQKEENKKQLATAKKKLEEAEKPYKEAQKHLESLRKQGFKSGDYIYDNALKQVGSLASAYNTARANVIQLENAQKELNGQIKTNNNITENAEVSVDKYASASKKLKKKLKDLGASQKTQKSITKELNKALDNGEISWKDYKKIVDGNYKSVGDLEHAIEKLKPKSVKVEAETEGTENVEELEKTLSSLEDKTVKAKIESGDAKTINKLAKEFGKFSNKTIAATIEPKLRKDWVSAMAKKIKSDWAKIKTPEITVGTKAVSASVQTESGKKLSAKQSDKYTKLFNAATKGGGLYNNSAGVLMIPTETAENNKKMKKYLSKYKELLAYCQKVGIMASAYATGGFPEDGLFYANHSELVGKFSNGKTAVANNEQITQGFADGITKTLAPAIYSAVKQAMSETQNNGGDTVINLDGKKIAESTVKHINRMTRSRGNNPIVGLP